MISLFILICLGFASVAALAHLVIRKMSTWARKENHNEVTAAVYATFGVLYALILGLLVGHSQERRDSVVKASVRESFLLVDLSRAADIFDSTHSQNIRLACIEYATYVRDVEWPLLESSLSENVHHGHIDKLWKAVMMAHPKDGREESVYLTMLDILHSVSQERHIRIAICDDHIGFFLTFMLLTGAVMTIVFLWFFGMYDNRMHVLYTWLLTFMLSLVLCFILGIDNPVRKGIGVGPDDFDRALHRLELRK